MFFFLTLRKETDINANHASNRHKTKAKNVTNNFC